jgi:hypothetical protein
LTTPDLLAKFVRTFGVFDDLRVARAFDVDGDVVSVLAAPWDSDGWADWTPVQTDVPRAVVAEDCGGVLRGALPPLYEQLILSYRWAEVDVGRIRLLPNLPPGLKGLAAAIRRDDGLYSALSKAGYLQFGKGPGVDYDPVCFDLGRRRPDGDCRIVQFDHEQILCNERLVEVAELASSFRGLMELIIEDANRKRTRADS